MKYKYKRTTKSPYTDKQFKKESAFKGSRTLLKEWKAVFDEKCGKTPKQFIKDAIVGAESIMTKTGSLR